MIVAVHKVGRTQVGVAIGNAGVDARGVNGDVSA
jgi:hypothetical protein